MERLCRRAYEGDPVAAYAFGRVHKDGLWGFKKDQVTKLIGDIWISGALEASKNSLKITPQKLAEKYEKYYRPRIKSESARSQLKA